jgi:serine/threonine-protein kinase HipA
MRQIHVDGDIDFLGDSLGAPLHIGTIDVVPARGRERHAFAFSEDVLASFREIARLLDPDLLPYAGSQFPPESKLSFGLVADASPDRWGRMLMDRRLARMKRKGEIDPAFRLMESDYLLGVHDAYRVGAMRFRLPGTGYLDDQHDTAAPPLVALRELEAASRALELDVTEGESDAADEWLRMLIAPGGSLGGARPKASVVDDKGVLWIAKFPSTNDRHDVGGWEAVAHELANACELSPPNGVATRYNKSSHHTFRIARFDRDVDGRRRHFASAMTLTGQSDGADFTTGASYLQIAEVIIRHGAEPNSDLRQLWLRIVFNMLVSNCDDHLRNHGFLLTANGWRLSPPFDVNPDPRGTGLKLLVDGHDNELDLGLARSVAHLFRVSAQDASEQIAFMVEVVRQWRDVAQALSIPRTECERMAPAFALADEAE